MYYLEITAIQLNGWPEFSNYVLRYFSDVYEFFRLNIMFDNRRGVCLFDFVFHQFCFLITSFSFTYLRISWLLKKYYCWLSDPKCALISGTLKLKSPFQSLTSYCQLGTFYTIEGPRS